MTNSNTYVMTSALIKQRRLGIFAVNKWNQMTAVNKADALNHMMSPLATQSLSSLNFGADRKF